MKFNINAQPFLEALRAVSCNVGESGTVAASFLMALRGGILTVASVSDSRSAVRVTVAIEVEAASEGRILVPGKYLTGAMAEFENVEGPVVFEDDGRMGSLTWQGGRCSFPVDDPAAFPPARSPEKGSGMIATMEASDLAMALSTTIYASEIDTLREMINAVNVSFENGLATLAATNRFILAIRRIPCTLPEGMPTVSIPIAAARILLPLLRSRKGDVAFVTDGKNISVSADALRVDTYAVPHRFPAYGSILNGRILDDHTATVDRTDLLRMVKRLRALSGHILDVFEVTLREDAIGMRVTGTRCGGDIADSIPAKYEGRGAVICLKAELLEDVLSKSLGESVRLIVSEPSKPCFVEDAFDGLAVITPSVSQDQ